MNMKKTLVKSIVPEIIKWLISGRQRIFLLKEEKIIEMEDINYCDEKELINSCDVIFAIGGDGTLLRTARIIGNKEIPILGINLGGLGFLTEVPIEHLYPAMTKLLAGKSEIEERMVLESKVKNNVFYGLNEIVITHRGSGRMLNLGLYIDKIRVSEFFCDGMIISTPTGSTAYSLAASGPIVYPTMDAIIINFICPHTLGARPMIISSNSNIKIECSESMLVVDGQQTMLLEEKNNVEIKKANYKVKLIKCGIYNFYELLRNKLRWGGWKER